MKILFISSGSIGDAIISTGILGYLMDRYANAQFTVAVGPAGVSLFEPCPRITRVIPIRKLPYNRHWLVLWQQTRGTAWDMVVDLRGSLLGYFLNARKRVVFRNPDKSISKAAQLAALFGLNPPPPTRLWASEQTRAQARTLLPEGKKNVIFAPRTNSVAKDWPLERFAKLAHKLATADTAFVIMASAAQRPSLEPLFQAMPEATDLCGKTDLSTAYAVIEQAALFIGSDSGLLHMAAAAKTPSVGIYGPSNDKTYAPNNEKLRLVTVIDFRPGEPERHDKPYIQMVSVEMVEAKVRELNVL